MADSKITALTSISTSTDPANDPLVIVDVSDTSMAATGTTKKVTLNQLLGASGTATLASATISGDLTVDTSTLKVTASTDTVTVGATTTDAKFRVVDASYNGLRIGFLPGTANYNLYDATVHEFRTANVTPQQLYTLQASSSVWYDGAGGTRMTLNSTGLGVGGSPTRKLSIVGSGNTYANINSGDNTSLVGVLFGGSSAPSNGQIIYNNTDNSMGLHTAGAVKLTIDSSGNVGIGVTPSATSSTYFQALEIARVGQGLTAAKTALTGSPSSWLSNNSYATYSSGIVWNYAISQPAAQYRLFEGQHQWFNAPSGTAGNAITFTQAMTLDASGNLNLGVTSPLINTTRRLSVSGTVAAALQSTGAATVETINVWHTATSGNNVFVDFDTEAAVTSRGSISYNRAGGLVAYNTTSDYRAKDIIGPVSNSGSLIDSLKVYVGKMKGATIERPMLIAHEAQEVAPYAVTGTKDEVDADGKPKYQQMDASALVPLLIAEIQSLRARVQTLETR